MLRDLFTEHIGLLALAIDESTYSPTALLVNMVYHNFN